MKVSRGGVIGGLKGGVIGGLKGMCNWRSQGEM